MEATLVVLSVHEFLLFWFPCAVVVLHLDDESVSAVYGFIFQRGFRTIGACKIQRYPVIELPSEEYSLDDLYIMMSFLQDPPLLQESFLEKAQTNEVFICFFRIVKAEPVRLFILNRAIKGGFSFPLINI